MHSLEVKREAQDHFNQKVLGSMDRTVWNSGGCNSWYLHPVSGRNCTIWPGFTWRFQQITKHFDPAAYHFNRLPALDVRVDPRSQTAAQELNA